MHLFDLLNEKQLKTHIDEGFISARQGPTGEIVYNYTPSCQFSNLWDECTMQCRGLITDEKGEIIARPFKKFFNLNQNNDPIPSGPPLVFDKMDGCLGIIFWNKNDELQVSTRGSSTSDQAKAATQFLREHAYKYMVDQPIEWTTLVEICLPETKIVLDYRDKYGLYCLGAVNVDSGAELVPREVAWWGGPRAESFGFSDIDSLDKNRENAEGYVLVWENLDSSFFRLKVKQDDYLRIHRAIMELTPKHILELMENKEIGRYLLDLPDELLPTAQSIIAQFDDEICDIFVRARLDFQRVLPYNSRAEKARMLTNSPVKSVVFAMMDIAEKGEGRAEYLSSFIFKILKKKLKSGELVIK